MAVLNWYLSAKHPRRRLAAGATFIFVLLLIRLIEWEKLVATRDGGLGDDSNFHVHMAEQRRCFVLSEGGSPHLPRAPLLDLSGCDLYSLPHSFPWGVMHALVELDLENNALSALPDQIADIPRLRTLQLAGNRFKQLPPAIRLLQHLEVLDLGQNQLHSLGVGSLPAQLTQLSVSDNRLRCVAVNRCTQ